MSEAGFERGHIWEQIDGALRRGGSFELSELFPRNFDNYPWKLRTRYPSKRNLQETPYVIFEITGLYKSGKSSFIKEIQKNPPGNVRLIVQPEFQTGLFGVAVADYEAAFQVEGYNLEANVLNRVKLLALGEAEFKANSLLLGDLETGTRGLPIVVIVERGAHDALVHSIWNMLTRYQMDALPLENAASALWFADHTSAVVLYGNTLDKARERAVSQGQPPEGKMRNRIIWPTIEIAYSAWLSAIDPRMRDITGQGLLVVDGTQPLEENNQRVMGYINRTIEKYVKARGMELSG